jgi:hypothetical protein
MSNAPVPSGLGREDSDRLDSGETANTGETRGTGQVKEAVPDLRVTPYGILYRPRSMWIQAPLLIGAFLGSIGIAEGVGRGFGGVSEAAQIFLYLPFVLVLVLGYSLWMARLQALAFDMLGRGLLKALFILIVFRRKPKNPEEFMPTVEKIEKMAVRAQQATSSFWMVSLPIGFVGAAGALLIDAPAGPISRAFAVGAGCVVWGVILAFLGRRGWLPILEEG